MIIKSLLVGESFIKATRIRDLNERFSSIIVGILDAGLSLPVYYHNVPKMQACFFIKQQYDRHLKSGNCDEVWALKVANFDFTCDKTKRVGDLFTFIIKKVTKGRN